MKSLGQIAFAVLACAFACLALAQAPKLKAGVFNPPRQAPDFTLRGSHGLDVSMREFQGKVVVLGFGYTSCPDVCPTTLSTLTHAHRQLGPAAANVQVLYVTVDPERDDVERMKEYVSAFNPTFIGVTGSTEQLAAVRKSYGVQAEKKSAGDSYVVAHSSYTYLIDRKGRLRALMPYGRAPTDYVHDLNILLKE